MRAVRQFNVVPAIPPRLAALGSLANNIRWTWDRQTQALFAQLDPPLWESSGHDPLRLIAGITAGRWAELSADPEIVALTDAAADRLAQATTEPRWFQGRPDSPLQLVAYFSPEFGLTETVGMVAQFVALAASDSSLRDTQIDIGGPENLTMHQVVATFQSVSGRSGKVNVVPLPVLRVASVLMRLFNPTLARQMQGAIVMDTRSMAFDAASIRRQYPAITSTSVADVARQYLQLCHKQR